MSKLFCRFPSANQKGKRVGVCPLYAVGVEPTASGVAIRLARGSVADQINVTGVSEEEVMDKLEECAEKLEHSLLGHVLNPDMGQMQDRLLGMFAEMMQAQLKVYIVELKSEVRQLVSQELQTLAVSDVPPPPGDIPKPAAPKKK